MKILLISASPHKETSETFCLAKEVLKGCADSGESEIIHISDHEIGFCRHCEMCHTKIMECPIKDDAMGILEKMIASDGIILASPNYISQVTGLMKNLFDRSGHFIHCKRLLGKYIAGVVSSGSGEDKAVLDYMKYYGHVCGAQYAGGVSSCRPVSNDTKEEAFLLGKSLCAAIRDKKIFPDQMKILEAGHERFKTIMTMRKNDWPDEYRYWQNKGWL